MTTKFLFELIQNNSRVILPEFGAFLVKDDGSGVFKVENLTFSPFLRYNDGMVEDALAKAENISKDEAKKKITAFIDDLKETLIEKKYYELEGLGALHTDKRGGIHFTSIASEKNDKSLAKDKPEAKPVSKIPEDPKRQEEKNIVAKQDQAEEKKKIQPKAASKKDEPAKKPEDKLEQQKPEAEANKNKTTSPPPLVTSTDTKPESKSKPTPKPQATKQPPKKPHTIQDTGTSTGKAILMGTLIGVAFVVLVAGGWYLYNSGMLNFKKDKEEQILTETEAFDSKIKEDITEAEEVVDDESKGKFEDEYAALSDQIDKDASTDETHKETSKDDRRLAKTEVDDDDKLTISYPQEGMYHIVVGSFRNAAYAEKFSEDMKMAGFKSRVLLQPSGMQAVTLGSFLSRQEAVDSLNQWRSQYPNVWLLNQ